MLLHFSNKHFVIFLVIVMNLIIILSTATYMHKEKKHKKICIKQKNLSCKLQQAQHLTPITKTVVHF